MEKFKAVEKEMKTKAYSKTGLSAALKLDPDEQKKVEAEEFLSSMVEELERQIETMEAEGDALQATMKKGKKDTSKADRLAEIERITEKHKWHQGRLELMLRSLRDGRMEADQVTDLEESIKYYVENNNDVEFMEDDSIYDDLNLEQEEGVFGMNNETDRVSSQDTQSVHDDVPDIENRGASTAGAKSKSSSVSEAPVTVARRTSGQLKSPLPALATLHTTLSNATNGASNSNMKPAPLPTRAPGETLKYASAAAAAAASDKNGVGIAPLPPPPGAAAQASTLVSTAPIGLAPLPPAPGVKASALPAQSSTASQSASQKPVPPATEASPGTQTNMKSPTPSHSSVGVSSSVADSVPQTPALEKVESVAPSNGKSSAVGDRTVPTSSQPPLEPEPTDRTEAHASANTPASLLTNGNLDADIEVDESIYHLPPGLQDLIQSFEITKSRVSQNPTPSTQRLLNASHATCPDSIDAERPRHYKPQMRYATPPHYPQEPLPIFDDPRLYTRIDVDTLFFIFYYCQGTYQQYLAAKSLKSQSWRFHKQYQTWFQRHEEPKTITEEYEQGTYRFFDYESTWFVPTQPLPCMHSVLSTFSLKCSALIHYRAGG